MYPLGGFDEVVAITQKHINDNLIARYKLYKSLRSFKAVLEDDEDGSMTGTMSPPTVELHIHGEPRKARFKLHFETGSFTFQAKLDGDAKRAMHSLPMDGWTLSFISNLADHGLNDVPQDMQNVVSDEVRRKISKAGSYSLKQVMIDFTTSDILDFDLNHSIAPGLSVSNGKDIKQKVALKNFIFEYLQKLCKDGHTVLGYAITIDEAKLDPNNEASFPPVSVKIQTMPYDINSKSKPNDHDVFMFCEMVGDVSGRAAPVNALEGSFPWCKPPDLGKMVISKATIWDRYFRDHLRFLNRESLLLLNEIGTWVKSKGSQGGKPEEQAAWDLTDGAFPYADDAAPPAWTEISEMGAKFAWSGLKKREERSNAFGGYSSTQKWTTTSSATVEVRIDPGTSQFIASCTLSWHYQVALNSSSKESMHSSQDNYKADIQWTLKLGFNSVEAGHLGFKDPVITIDSCKCYIDHDSQGIFQFIFGGTIVDDNLIKTVTELVKQRIETSGLVKTVRKGLEQQAGFIFPGGRTFKMKNPTFTTDGDIEVGLTYLGNQK